VAAIAVFFMVGLINPYAKGGNSDKQKRPAGFAESLAAQAYKEDPALRSGTAPSMATPAPRDARRVAPRPHDAMTPTMAPDAMTPDAMTPDAMTPDAMTPTMAPDAMTPAMAPDTMAPPAGGAAEAARLAGEAEKELKRSRIKAEKLAEKALALDNTQPLARKVMAKVLEAKAKASLYAGRNAAAVKFAMRATSLDPALATPWFYLGVANNELRKKAEAKAALQQYLLRCPKCGYNSTFARQILKSTP